MSKAQVTVGRIVHYKADGGDVLPAIVTQVNGDAVNLRVFTNDPGRPAPLLTGVKQGKKKGQWDWPPRAGD